MREQAEQQSSSGSLRLPWGKLLLVVVIAVTLFVWWPPEEYGEGPFWNIKRSVDTFVADVTNAEENRQRFIDDVEAHVLELTNKRRRANNLPELKHDSRIDTLARNHSRNMLAQDALSHTLDGLDSNDRARAAGYDCRRDLGNGRYSFGLAENIAYREPYSNTALRTAEELVSGWMRSPGHRENILDAEFARIGVGIAVDRDKLYATQNFSPCL